MSRRIRRWDESLAEHLRGSRMDGIYAANEGLPHLTVSAAEFANNSGGGFGGFGVDTFDAVVNESGDHGLALADGGITVEREGVFALRAYGIFDSTDSTDTWAVRFEIRADYAGGYAGYHITGGTGANHGWGILPQISVGEVEPLPAGALIYLEAELDTIGSGDPVDGGVLAFARMSATRIG